MTATEGSGAMYSFSHMILCAWIISVYPNESNMTLTGVIFFWKKNTSPFFGTVRPV